MPAIRITRLRQMSQVGSAKKRFARPSLAHTGLSPEGGRVTCRPVRTYPKYPPSPATGDRKLSLGGTPRVTSHESPEFQHRAARPLRASRLFPSRTLAAHDPRVSFTDLRIRECGRQQCCDRDSIQRQRERKRVTLLVFPTKYLVMNAFRWIRRCITAAHLRTGRFQSPDPFGIEVSR